MRSLRHFSRRNCQALVKIVVIIVAVSSFGVSTNAQKASWEELTRQAKNLYEKKRYSEAEQVAR